MSVHDAGCTRVPFVNLAMDVEGCALGSALALQDFQRSIGTLFIHKAILSAAGCPLLRHQTGALL